MKKKFNFSEARFSKIYGFPPEDTDNIFHTFYDGIFLRNADDGYLAQIPKSIRNLRKAIPLIENCYLPVNQHSILKSLNLALKIMENEKSRRRKGSNSKGGRREDEEFNVFLDELVRKINKNGKIHWAHIKWLIDWHRTKRYLFSPNAISPWGSLLPSTSAENLRGRYNAWKKKITKKRGASRKTKEA